MDDSSKTEERLSVFEAGLQAETIYDPSLSPQLQFAVRRNGKDTVECPLVYDSKRIVPPSNIAKIVHAGAVLLPSGVADYGTQAELLASIREFIHRYGDMPPLSEEILAHYVLMTWVYDCFTAVPYLRFIGEPGTGKSRMLQIMGQLCYRPISAGGATSSASIFRLVDLFHGTLIIDEADYRFSDIGSDVIKILNTGYMAGNPIWRCVGDNNDLQAFDVFGPKVIGNRERFADAALETRCITFETSHRNLRADIPRQLPHIFWNEGLRLRNKLLKWKFDAKDSIKVDENPLYHLEPRLTQIGTPIYAVSNDLTFKKRFIAFMDEYATEQRAFRPETLVVEAVLNLAHENTPLRVKSVAEEAMRISREHENAIGITPKRAGQLLRTVGFKTHETRAGYVFIPEARLLTELSRRYGFDREQKQSEQSDAKPTDTSGQPPASEHESDATLSRIAKSPTQIPKQIETESVTDTLRLPAATESEVVAQILHESHVRATQEHK